MRISNNDKKTLEFIQKFNVATTNTIYDLFYPSLRMAQYRLKALYDNKILKRDRDHFTSQYCYYYKKPKQLRHDLLLTEFYRVMNKLAQIEFFEKEFPLDDVRPDGLMAYRHKNKSYIAFVEVQIANTALDVKKYEKLYQSERYKKYFPTFPLVYAITNQTIPRTGLKIIQVREDMSNLKL